VSLPRSSARDPDLVVRRGDRQYVIEIKSSAEARRDRLVPLLAQAILEAKAAASRDDLSSSARPMAIVGAPNLPESLIDDLKSFAKGVAPDVPIGIIDLDGSHIFVGDDVEALSRLVSPRGRRSHAFQNLAPKLDLFSDLNQWMLKVLLAPGIPENLMRAPRERILGVSDLARVANVSLMSASRCVRLLRAEGFLDESRALHLVNVEALMNRWRIAQRKPIREVPMRWVIPGDPKRQLSDAVRAYVKGSESVPSARRGAHAHRAGSRPRICLGLFAAANILGFGFVHGVAPHLYLESLDLAALESLGLLPAHSGQRADVFIRVPAFRESVFRPAVAHEGVPASDILQVWLDVGDHPARGPSQAEQVWRRVIVPLVKRARA
jgi:hypothetical protein